MYTPVVIKKTKNTLSEILSLDADTTNYKGNNKKIIQVKNAVVYMNKCKKF
jgi:hypothetical protein